MKHAAYLGKILKIKIYVHWTFAFLIGWVVWSNAKAGLGWTDILWVLGLTMGVFACIVLHELGHALMARKYNVVTQSITLLPIGGVAQMDSIPEKPRQELLIALAGPAVNFLIVFILTPFINIHALTRLGTLNTVGPGNFLFFLTTVNLWLAIFNLIPAFPMDGGRVLRALLAFRLDHAKATRIATYIGQVFGAVFFVAGFFFDPMLVFIGMFIFVSGQYESALAGTTQFLHRYRVSDVAMREIPSIDRRQSMKDAAQMILNTQNRNFLVTDQGKPVGTITRERIITAMNETGSETLVEQVEDRDCAYVPEEMPLDEAWKLMQRDKKALMLVGTSHQLNGILDEENIVEFIQLHAQDK
jgi:Zn-dependent protease/predicted transcriptional regulator